MKVKGSPRKKNGKKGDNVPFGSFPKSGNQGSKVFRIAGKKATTIFFKGLNKELLFSMGLSFHTLSLLILLNITKGVMNISRQSFPIPIQTRLCSKVTGSSLKKPRPGRSHREKGFVREIG